MLVNFACEADALIFNNFLIVNDRFIIILSYLGFSLTSTDLNLRLDGLLLKFNVLFK